MFKGMKNRFLGGGSSRKSGKDAGDEKGGGTGGPSSPRTSPASSTEVTSDSPREEPPKKVSMEDFDLLMVIGRGTFGKVMQVRKKDTQEIFAMKVIRKDFVIQHEQIIHTKAEKSIMQRVDHPFIVSLRYAFQTGDKLYMILDYVNGGELFYHLRSSNIFPENRVRLYIAEITLAIDYLHENGIMYRDLKPENVLVDNEGHVRLTDFGLSKELETRDRKHHSAFIGESPPPPQKLSDITSSSTTSTTTSSSGSSSGGGGGGSSGSSSATSTKGDRAHTFCGTPDYLAPEILTADPLGKGDDENAVGYGKEVDWWAVGILMFEMLVGEPPFYHENTHTMYKKIIREEVVFPPDISPLARSLIQGLLQKNPKSRLDGPGVMAHPFFKGLDFEAVYHKKIQPLWKPAVQSMYDGSQVPDEFRTEMPTDSVVDNNMSRTMKAKAEHAFEGFTYNGNANIDVQTKSRNMPSVNEEDDDLIEGYLAK